jgi:hypothetical protein
LASSGTYNFAPSIGQCTIAAFERIQLRLPQLRTEHFNTAFFESNLLMAQFSNLQPNLWKVTQTPVNLVSGTASYSIPSNVVMILDAWISTNFGSSQQSDTYITPFSRTEYASTANKSTPGKPTTYWFDRTPPAQTITMWPVPDASGPYVLNYFACLQMQDSALQSGQTPDLPYLWLDAYVAGMAHRLARVYKPELEAIRKTDAGEAWKIAAEQGVENVPLSFAPTIRTYYRR